MTKKKFNPRTLCIILTFVFLYMPIGVLILYSFNAGDSTAVFKGFSLRWYKELFTDTATLNALKNTLVLAILSSIISTIIGTAAAYGISKMRNKYIKNITMSATQIPMINPEIVTGISMMLLFVFVANIINSTAFLGFWTVLIAHITFNLPYVILLVLPKFKEMDKSLPEAALDLGCTPFQSFFKVELPAIMPGIIAGFIMAFTLSIDDFVISYFTTGSGFETLPIRIYSMTKKRVTPDMYALSTLIFVTILVLLLVSNLASGKNKIELSKKAKRIVKIIGGSVFGIIGITTIIILCISATTEVKTVNVYNWGEYISDGGDDSLDVNKEFEKWAQERYEKEYGKKVKVQVNYTTYASNEDLYSKLANGAGGYDVIVPSDYMLEKMKSEGLLQPLDLEKYKLENLKYLNTQFENMFVYERVEEKEDGSAQTVYDRYGVPYTYGIVGIVYNAKAIEENAPLTWARINETYNGESVVGWEILFEEPYLSELKGQILQFNNPRDAFGSAMYHLGIDVNNPSEKDWQDAYNLLEKQKGYVQGYVMDEIYNKMEKGEAWVAAYYAGDCLCMMGENPDLDFFYPKNSDGKYETNVFADAMCIPKNADPANLELAHWYIDYMMSDEAATANAEYIYYGSPYDNVKENEDYKLDMGCEYLYETDAEGNLVKDEDGNPIPKLDENGNYIIVPASDYAVIYNEDFESDLANMFAKYAYKDLTNVNLTLSTGETKSNLTILNENWEKLKIESTSMVGIYIICAVIAIGIVGFIVYLQVKKRRQRRLYWGAAPTPKAKPKAQNDLDLSETVTIAITKSQKKDK